jgi:hypothetical protein
MSHEPARPHRLIRFPIRLPFPENQSSQRRLTQRLQMMLMQQTATAAGTNTLRFWSDPASTAIGAPR